MRYHSGVFHAIYVISSISYLNVFTMFSRQYWDKVFIDGYGFICIKSKAGQ